MQCELGRNCKVKFLFSLFCQLMIKTVLVFQEFLRLVLQETFRKYHLGFHFKNKCKCLPKFTYVLIIVLKSEATLI